MSKFTLEIEPSKFGTAKVHESEYYSITSGKEKIEKEVVKRKLEWHKFEKEMV